MVFTRKKRLTNKRLLSQLDDFDQDMNFGNAASERQENAVFNEGTNDRDFTVSSSSNNTAVNESAMNVKTLERCFNERIDREMSNIVDTVEDRIRNAILTAIENIVAPKIELAIRSINASSGQDVTSASATSERREYIGSNVPFENASENNNTLGVTNVNDETRQNIPDEVSELSVPGTHFDRQPHTHHMVTGAKEQIHNHHDMVARGSEKFRNGHHMVTGPSNLNHHMVTGTKEHIHNRHHMVTEQTAQTNQFPEFLTGRILTPHSPPSHQYQNLSTQVLQDNNLPMVEQTPRNQNSDANNSINNFDTHFRPLPEVVACDPYFVDPQYGIDPYWDEEIYDQDKLEYKDTYNKPSDQIECDDSITEAHVSDALRYAVIDLWTVNPQLPNTSPLPNFRPRPQNQQRQISVINDQILLQLQVTPDGLTRFLPLSTNLPLKNQ